MIDGAFKFMPQNLILALPKHGQTPRSGIFGDLWQCQPLVTSGQLLSQHDHLRVLGPTVPQPLAAHCRRSLRVRLLLLLYCFFSPRRGFRFSARSILLTELKPDTSNCVILVYLQLLQTTSSFYVHYITYRSKFTGCFLC